MTELALTIPPGYTRKQMHPALSTAKRLRQRMLDLRAEALAAEQAYHDAVVRAAELPNPDAPTQTLFSVQQIADAVGTSRAPIYKRLDRVKLGGSYGARPPVAEAS